MSKRLFVIILVGVVLIGAGCNKALVKREAKEGLPIVKIKQIIANKEAYKDKIVRIKGEIISISKGENLGKTVFTVYRIDDGGAIIDAVYRGELKYSVGASVRISGVVRYELPWWGPQSAPVVFIEIKKSSPFQRSQKEGVLQNFSRKNFVSH